MPIYDYECLSCKTKETDVFTRSWDEKRKCKACGKIMKRLFPIDSRFYPDIFPAEGIFLEHVSPEGKRFFSKKEMRDYAEEHDLELGALE